MNKGVKTIWFQKTLPFKQSLTLLVVLSVKLTEQIFFPAKWIGCDATFGSDLHFLKSLPEHLYYFADIRSDTKVFLKKPKLGLPAYKGRGRHPKNICVLPDQPQALTVAKLAGSSKLSFKPVILAEGAKGPVVAETARIRAYLSRDGLPEDASVRLLIRRNSDGQIKFAISSAPEDMSFTELCTASTMRWPIEQFFKEGNDQIGMDHYEHRSWPAWHRHMVYVFLALNFLFRLRIRFKKSSMLDTATGSHIACNHVTTPIN